MPVVLGQGVPGIRHMLFNDKTQNPIKSRFVGDATHLVPC